MACGPSAGHLTGWRQDDVEFDGGSGRGEAPPGGTTNEINFNLALGDREVPVNKHLDGQILRASKPGDLVIWYAAGRQEYIARGRADAIPTG